MRVAIGRLELALEFPPSRLLFNAGATDRLIAKSASAYAYPHKRQSHTADESSKFPPTNNAEITSTTSEDPPM